MNRTLLALSVIVSAGLAHAEMSLAPFDLTNNGTEICKTRPGSQERTCYTALNEKNLQLKVATQVNLVERVKAYQTIEAQGRINDLQLEELDQVGGAIYMSAKNRSIVAKNFSELTISDIGADLSGLQGDVSDKVVPFLAVVHFTSLDGKQGQVNVDGLLHLHGGEFHEPQNIDSSAAAEVINQRLAEEFFINGISDVASEAQINGLRSAQRDVRAVQIRSIYGASADVDAKTADLIKQVIGPAVVADVVMIPMVKAIVKALVDGIGDIFNAPPKTSIQVLGEINKS